MGGLKDVVFVSPRQYHCGSVRVFNSIATLAVLTCADAGAAPLRPLSLRYQRIDAGSCPDEATVRSAVSGRLGFDPFVTKASAQLAVTLEPFASGFRAELNLVDESGVPRNRRLTGVEGDCSDLAATLPFALSVAVEAFSAGPQVRATKEPIPLTQPREPTTPWGVAGTMRAGGTLGAAPNPTLVAGLGFGFWRGVASLALEARFVLPAALVVQTGRIEAWSVAGEVAPCIKMQWLTGCGLLGAGALMSRAVGLADATSARTPLITLGGRLEFALPLGRWLAAAAFIDVRGALTRTSLKVGPAEVWVTPPLAGGMGLAFSLSWPEQLPLGPVEARDGTSAP